MGTDPPARGTDGPVRGLSFNIFVLKGEVVGNRVLKKHISFPPPAKTPLFFGCASYFLGKHTKKEPNKLSRRILGVNRRNPKGDGRKGTGQKMS